MRVAFILVYGLKKIKKNKYMIQYELLFVMVVRILIGYMLLVLVFV